MNYLAHALLSGDNDAILTGNFLGDHFKGSRFVGLPAEMVKGIHLHRFIDSYTDAHPVVRQSIHQMRPHAGRYAGIFIDMWMDHILAANWTTFHPIPLPVFEKALFNRMNPYAVHFPATSRHMLKKMEKDSWLSGYRRVAGIQNALYGISRRASIEPALHLHLSHMNEQVLRKDDFHRFFCEMKLKAYEFVNGDNQ